jgi:hypothetical protein
MAETEEAEYLPRKNDRNLAIRSMMQFSVIFFRADTSINKQKHKFIP